jgi:hypothetical protein
MRRDLAECARSICKAAIQLSETFLVWIAAWPNRGFVLPWLIHAQWISVRMKKTAPE